MKRFAKQTRGAALIMALLLVAIVAAISTAIMFSQTVDIRRTIMKQAADQAYLDALYVPQWVQFQVQQLATQLQKQKEIPQWPQIMSQQNMNDGSVVNASFLPATARFNLNNLAQPVSQYLAVFSNLLQAVEPNMSAKTAKKITQNVQYWLLPVGQGQATQSSDPYTKMSPPYQAAHKKMTSSSELRLVAGINADLYRRLRPYIIALPETNIPIDLNAAAKPVLMALLGKNATAAVAVLQYRKENKGFLNTDQFFGLAAVKPFIQFGGKKNPLNTLVSVTMPTYYLIQTSIKKDKLNFHVVSILQFSAKTKTISIIRTGPSL